MVLRYYFRVIQQSWWLIAIITLLSWTVSLGISYATIPLFQARTSLIVYPNANLTSSRDMVTSLDTLDKRSITSTYENILNSNRVFEETLKTLGLKFQDVKSYSHYTKVQTGSNTIDLFVDGPDPSISAKIANGIGENSIRYIKGIYQVFDIAFLDQATPPSTRFKPQPLRDGGIALGIGVLMGIILAIIIDQLRGSLDALRRRSTIDKTSSAFTLRYFKRFLDQEIARNPLEPLSLALLELDGLQEIIDGLPESILTNIMQEITNKLRKQLRGNDTIGRWNQICFGLCLAGTPGLAATRTMERIRQVFIEPIIIPTTNETLQLYPCVGITERLKEDEPSNILIERAENALQQARQSDNKTIFYAEETQHA